jgi:hypothetical protein
VTFPLPIYDGKYKPEDLAAAIELLHQRLSAIELAYRNHTDNAGHRQIMDDERLPADYAAYIPVKPPAPVDDSCFPVKEAKAFMDYLCSFANETDYTKLLLGERKMKAYKHAVARMLTKKGKK